MQYMSFNVSNSGARTQDATIPTQHSASWATESDELMIGLDRFYWELWFMWLKCKQINKKKILNKDILRVF